MAKKDLQRRAIWQDRSGPKAAIAEKNFYSVFQEAFKNTSFRVRSHPNEFQNIYTNVVLKPSVAMEIYNPPQKITRHGITPDYAIDNTATAKTLYIEVKRQDGWVEGGKRSDGRGNAHERLCKYFTPGLLEVLRQKGKLGNNIFPFWIVFLGDITRDPCRVREITLWFKGCENHIFFWRNPADATPLLNHFKNRLKKHLL